MQRNEEYNKKVSSIILITSTLISIGLLLLSYNYVQAKKIVVYEYMNEKLKEKEQEIEKEVEVETKKIEIEEEKTPPAINENIDYKVGYLEIPKIGFRKELVDKDSEENNVEKNLFITNNSNYPDVEKGNLIIAGHSGTGYKAFFKNLYKLQKDDIAKVEYKGKTYIYKIVKIYEQRKKGTVAIYRDYEKTTLTLITCTKDNDQTQTIYISELISIE